MYKDYKIKYRKEIQAPTYLQVLHNQRSVLTFH